MHTLCCNVHCRSLYSVELQTNSEVRNMGIPARYEPSNTGELRRNAAVLAIFQAVDWMEFFERLNGFHCEATLQFALNLTETHSEVWGLRIEVYEAIIAEVTGIP